MTSAEALKILRQLDALAAQGWPGGYDAPAVKAEARAALDILTADVAALPEAEQPARALALRQKP